MGGSFGGLWGVWPVFPWFGGLPGRELAGASHALLGVGVVHVSTSTVAARGFAAVAGWSLVDNSCSVSCLRPSLSSLCSPPPTPRSTANLLGRRPQP